MSVRNPGNSLMSVARVLREREAVFKKKYRQASAASTQVRGRIREFFRSSVIELKPYGSRRPSHLQRGREFRPASQRQEYDHDSSRSEFFEPGLEVTAIGWTRSTRKAADSPDVLKNSSKFVQETFDWPCSPIIALVAGDWVSPGIHFLTDLGDRIYPVLDTVERINVISDSEDLYSGKPPASLKDLCLSAPIDVDEFSSIIRGICGPVIERLGINPVNNNADTGPQLLSFLGELLDRMHSSGPFFAAFGNLRELCLPLDGQTASLECLSPLLAPAPALQYLTFMASSEQDSDQPLATAATVLQCTVQIIPDESGGDRKVVCGAYQKPEWHRWRGIGPWWETE
ncbi:hypothetical protein B0H14DRAFT_3141637 [Mycena olivaceomarginata]|nr:hypothetical protein B0H14DRAFT_3141637 [Mycena olivaceomarginata]